MLLYLLQKIKNITLICLLLCCPLLNTQNRMVPPSPFGGPSPFAQGPQLPMSPGPQMGGPQPFNGPMEMPTEEEFEAMIKEIQRLESENPGMLKELELAGHRAILEMSDAELQMFSQFANITPEALREEATKALSEAESSMQPYLPNKEPEQTPEKLSKPEINKPEKIETTPSKADAKDIKDTLHDLITYLEELQQKSISVREVHTMVRKWLQELRELLFYTRVINHTEYIPYLSQPEFKTLINTLVKVKNTLKLSLANILLRDDISFESTPFDILGISSDASIKEIEAAYRKLEQEYDPKKIEERLRKEGFEEKTIQRQLKTNKLNFEIIQDAYDQLTDSTIHKQILRSIQEESKLMQQQIKQAQNAISTIQDALEEAIYKNDVLSLFIDFLAKYAPKQLERKKEMEEAEKKQLEEQKKRSSTTPQTSPGRFFEPEYMYPPRHSYNDNGYYSDYSPFSPWYNNYNPYSPDFGYNKEDEKLKEKSSSGEKSKSTEKEEKSDQKDKDKDKNKDKDKETKKKTNAEPDKKATKGEEALATKLDKRSPEEIASAIEKNLNTVISITPNQILNQPIISDFSRYLTSKVKSSKKPDTKKLDQNTEKKTEAETSLTEMTPEEKAGWESLPGVKDVIEEKSEEEQDKKEEPENNTKKEESEDMEDSPVDLHYNKKLLELQSNLKIDSLVKDTETLLQKIQLLHLKPSDKLRDIWIKIREMRIKNKDSLANISKQLEAIKKRMPEDKAAAHGPTLDSIINNINQVDRNLNAISEKI